MLEKFPIVLTPYQTTTIQIVLLKFRSSNIERCFRNCERTVSSSEVLGKFLLSFRKISKTF